LAPLERLCNDEDMAKTVIVKLTDDLDGGDAEETVLFALDGRSYEIDVNAANAARLRGALRPFIERARVRGAKGNARPPRSTPRAPAEQTMYSKLKDEEKARFRAWADMATARRISDARVRSWVAAGRP
jgi:nucleoid-associated protein Lsr2